MRPGFDSRRRSAFCSTNLPCLCSLPLQGKDGNTIFEYLVHDNGLEWVHWRERVPTWTYPTTGSTRFSQLIIPTLDSTRYEYLLSLVHSVGKVRPKALVLNQAFQWCGTDSVQLSMSTSITGESHGPS